MKRTDDADIRVCTKPSEWEDLLVFFESVAREQGWQPGNGMRAFPGSARYLSVSEHGALTGGVQVILPSAGSHLPYQTVWPEVDVPGPGTTAHITVLAFRAPSRGRPTLFWSLCGELWRFLVAEGMEAVVLEATPAMLKRYCRLGFPLERIGELRLHWGENCYLCRMDLRTVAGAMLMQARKSPIYRTLVGQAARSRIVHA